MLTLTSDELVACLDAVKPAELMGMALLKQGTPQLLPTDIPRDTLRDAVIEMVAYIDRCTEVAHRLKNLMSIPLAVPIPEFGL